MRALNEIEQASVDFLIERKINHAIMQLTGNGLSKSIFDATKNVRTFLAAEGVHDFVSQENGSDYKVSIPSFILTFSRSVGTQTTLYKASTRGDERIWFGSAITPMVSPDDIVVLFTRNGVLYLIDISKINIEKCWSSMMPNPIKNLIDKIIK